MQLWRIERDTPCNSSSSSSRSRSCWCRPSMPGYVWHLSGDRDISTGEQRQCGCGLESPFLFDSKARATTREMTCCSRPPPSCNISPCISAFDCLLLNTAQYYTYLGDRKMELPCCNRLLNPMNSKVSCLLQNGKKRDKEKKISMLC